MTYYVEPDYWDYGYADGDISSSSLVLGAGASRAVATPLIAGNYRVSSTAYLSSSVSSFNGAGSFIQTFPGINLNAKSDVRAAGNMKAANAALIAAQSDTRAGGRIFWEMTTPATGSWTPIVPQSEGSGE